MAVRTKIDGVHLAEKLAELQRARAEIIDTFGFLARRTPVEIRETLKPTAGRSTIEDTLASLIVGQEQLVARLKEVQRIARRT
jgi:hypothetical protein